MAQAPLTMKVTYNKHQSKLVDSFIKAYPELVEKSVRIATDFGKRMIIMFTPVKTGAARASWTIEDTPLPFSYAIVSTIGRGAAYTPALETGTGIWSEGGQPITPKKGDWLVFPIIEGNTIVRWVKTKSVNGMMGHFMVARSVKPTTERLSKGLMKRIREQWGKR